MLHQQEQQEWNALVNLFAQATTTQEMERLLTFFLTLSERDSLLDRYRIIRELLCSDQPQREIAAKLGVSLSKITAGSNELKRHPQDIKEYLRKEMALNRVDV